jgi:hypothetical protein
VTFPRLSFAVLALALMAGCASNEDGRADDFESEPLEMEGDAGPEQPAEGIGRGLLIKKVWLDRILAGTKTWEIRSQRTTRRGPISLIQSGSGTVVGTTEIVDVVGPLTLEELQQAAPQAGFLATRLPYAKTYAWVLKDAKRLPEPVPYEHPTGAVIWVRLAESVVQQIEQAMSPDGGTDGGTDAGPRAW